MSDPAAVEAILFAALELGSAAERAAYVDTACAGDAELRRQVEKLLKAHANVGDFLLKPVGDLLAAAPHDPNLTTDHHQHTTTLSHRFSKMMSRAMIWKCRSRCSLLA